MHRMESKSNSNWPCRANNLTVGNQPILSLFRFEMKVDESQSDGDQVTNIISLYTNKANDFTFKWIVLEFSSSFICKVRSKVTNLISLYTNEANDFTFEWIVLEFSSSFICKVRSKRNLFQCDFTCKLNIQSKCVFVKLWPTISSGFLCKAELHRSLIFLPVNLWLNGFPFY